MGLASIANVPNTHESFLEWSFNHMGHHFDIARRIYEVYQIATPIYPLDPFNPEDFYQHQLMHNNQNAILGIVGQDLLDVDWQDEGQRTAWIYLNFVEHQQAGAKLEV